jgi:pSer/pThr/pTyr-binding forkhead associated (FHA) protein
MAKRILFISSLLATRMSRQHFSIEFTEKGVFVEDLRSTNGTWINGLRVLSAPLSHQDKILAGQTVFEIELIAKEH